MDKEQVNTGWTHRRNNERLSCLIQIKMAGGVMSKGVVIVEGEGHVGHTNPQLRGVAARLLCGQKLGIEACSIL